MRTLAVLFPRDIPSLRVEIPGPCVATMVVVGSGGGGALQRCRDRVCSFYECVPAAERIDRCGRPSSIEGTVRTLATRQPMRESEAGGQYSMRFLRRLLRSSEFGEGLSGRRPLRRDQTRCREIGVWVSFLQASAMVWRRGHQIMSFCRFCRLISFASGCVGPGIARVLISNLASHSRMSLRRRCSGAANADCRFSLSPG